MKTVIVLNRKTPMQQIGETINELWFKLYSYLHTLILHPTQLGNVYWSNSDCYIIIGKSGYISKGKMIDCNGDVTPIKELVINTSNSVNISLSEPELNKIKKLAEEKHLSIKELILLGVDKLQAS